MNTLNANDNGGGGDLNELRARLKHGDAITRQEEIDQVGHRLAPRREVLRPREKDEDFELVDAAGNGRRLTAPRWLCHLLHLRHRCAHILLTFFHPGLGRIYLFQVRSWTKSDSPGFLDISAAGHVVGGASVDDAAWAELSEELGVGKHDLADGTLRNLGGYEHCEPRPKDNFFNCEWRQVYAGNLTAEGFQNLRFADGEVSGLFLCPEAQATMLLEQKTILIASALRQSLPLCLRAFGIVNPRQVARLSLTDPSSNDLVELEVRLNGVLAAFRREPGCRCARCTDPDLRQNGNASVSLMVKRNGKVVEHHLVDAGLSVVENLVACGGPWPVSSVLLTHAHFDHIAGLDNLVGSLARSTKSGELQGQRIPVPVYCTPETWVAGPKGHFPFLSPEESGKRKMEHREVVPGKPFVPGGYEGLVVTALPVVHFKDSVIYVVEFWRNPAARMRGDKPDAKVVLCWDLLRFLLPTDTKHHEFKSELTGTSELLRNPDLLVMEINTWNPRPATHHISYTEAKTLVELWSPKRVFFVHYAGAEDQAEGAPIDPQNSDPAKGPVAAADLERAIVRDLGDKASVGFAGRLFVL